MYTAPPTSTRLIRNMLLRNSAASPAAVSTVRPRLTQRQFNDTPGATRRPSRVLRRTAGLRVWLRRAVRTIGCFIRPIILCRTPRDNRGWYRHLPVVRQAAESPYSEPPLAGAARRPSPPCKREKPKRPQVERLEGVSPWRTNARCDAQPPGRELNPGRGQAPGS